MAGPESQFIGRRIENRVGTLRESLTTTGEFFRGKAHETISGNGHGTPARRAVADLLLGKVNHHSANNGKEAEPLKIELNHFPYSHRNRIQSTRHRLIDNGIRQILEAKVDEISRIWKIKNTDTQRIKLEKFAEKIHESHFADSSLPFINEAIMLCLDYCYRTELGEI